MVAEQGYCRFYNLGSLDLRFEIIESEEPLGKVPETDRRPAEFTDENIHSPLKRLIDFGQKEKNRKPKA